MRMTVKGQVTVPNVFRIKYGLLPHAEVEFKEKSGVLCLVKAKHGKKESRGEQLIRRMRSAKVDRSMTTEEIMELTRGYRVDDK
jgi:bifunctional DNA-binding transcriptional regulator/antitoxin component of YhaV-PrlF toxin-antitoxin module